MGGTEHVTAIGRPLFESLEPRLLLNAAAEQAVVELFSTSPALFVENQDQWADEAVRYMHDGADPDGRDCGLAPAGGARADSPENRALTDPDGSAMPPPDGYALSGSVSYSGSAGGTIFVGLFEDDSFVGDPVAGTAIASPGAYAIPLGGVASGTYYGAAFRDCDGDDELDWAAPEPLGVYGTAPVADPITVPSAGDVTGIDIALRDPDGVAPALVSPDPADGETGVPLDERTICFTFNERMAPTYSVTWSANLDVSHITQAWSPDGTTVTFTSDIDWPSGEITWELNPDGYDHSFADWSGTRLAKVSGSFTAGDVLKPTADLAHPAEGATIPPTTINTSERYIDVTFGDQGGSDLDDSTIEDAAQEFTLSGAAASSVALNGAATAVGGSTYRYAFSGDFEGGAVDVDFIAGTWADHAGNVNLAQTEGFSVAIPGDATCDGSVSAADLSLLADGWPTPLPDALDLPALDAAVG
jgi:hypothetical protein